MDVWYALFVQFLDIPDEFKALQELLKSAQSVLHVEADIEYIEQCRSTTAKYLVEYNAAYDDYKRAFLRKQKKKKLRQKCTELREYSLRALSEVRAIMCREANNEEQRVRMFFLFDDFTFFLCFLFCLTLVSSLSFSVIPYIMY